MTEQASKSRFAIDIDELERQLRQTASTSPGKAGPAADPLAELARIVGKDDPFKAMFDKPKATPPVVTPPQVVVPPQVVPADDEFLQADKAPGAPSVVDDSLRGALSEFDSLLREEFGPRPDAAAAPSGSGISVEESDRLSSHIDEIMREQQRDQVAIGASDARISAVQAGQDGAYETAEPDLVPLTPRSNRKGLLMIVGLVGVAAIGVVGAVTFKPGPKVPSGEPPTIKAAAEPTKVQPQNPGGTVVPNQDRQILERQPDAKPADTKVVTTEEQPMDVQAAARQATRVVLPGAPAVAPTPAPVGPAVTPLPATPAPVVAAPVAAAPAAPPPATAPLGEPRRVRTVAIRPDGSVIGQPPAAGAAPAAPATPSITAMGAPSVAAPVQPSARPAAVAPAPTSAPVAATTPAAAPVKTAERITAPPAAAATPAPRPAAAAPAPAAQRSAAAPAVAAPAATAPAAAETTGGFAVQLGAPGSEAEARSSFAALQRRFPEQLGNRAPVVRKAELADGRTVYRLRVGPLSRESATSLCQSLQSSGGTCFIARN